jgi:NADH-quinone oxidoreductase subunit J
MVLFLFVVMMLDINIDRFAKGSGATCRWGDASALLMVMEMGLVLGGKYFRPAGPQRLAARCFEYSNVNRSGADVHRLRLSVSSWPRSSCWSA